MKLTKKAVKAMIEGNTLTRENLNNPDVLKWVIEILQEHEWNLQGYATDADSIWEMYDLHVFFEEVKG